MHTLYKWLERSGRNALADQLSDGTMPPGHNGPYHDPETPVRNTGHWLITWTKLHVLTGSPCFRTAAERAAQYLLSSSSRPGGYTFHHRLNPEKDACNGTVGQAWTVEALVTAGEALDMGEAIEQATAVFMLHPFDEDLALWRRVELDGQVRSLDVTFNHQLWFAAAAGLLAPHVGGEVERRVQAFLDKVSLNLRLHQSGLIRHAVLTKRSLKARLVSHLRPLKKGKEWRDYLYLKEVGYHAFNTYAFALLKRSFPGHDVWQTPSVRRAIGYVGTREYWRTIERSRYGFPYNPPGIEAAFTMQTFAPDSGREAAWLRRQHLLTADSNTGHMSKGTEDPVTGAARLYEATRLSDRPIG